MRKFSAALVVAVLALGACQERAKQAEPPAVVEASPAIVGNFQLDSYRGATVSVAGDVITVTRVADDGPQGVRIRRIRDAVTPARANFTVAEEEHRFAVMRARERQYPESEQPYRAVIGPNALDDVVIFSRSAPTLTITMSEVADCGQTAEAACLGGAPQPAPAAPQ